MLKITSILSSLIFLLFVGTGSYARTFAKQNQQEKTEAKEKQEKDQDSSNEGDVDGKPIETVVQLDVFQAISLVNAQLRWKDYHSENPRLSRSGLFSKKQIVEVRQSEETTELFDIQSVAIALPGIENNFAFTVWSECKDEVNVSTQRNLKEHESTIAFMLNCGTYPLIQS